MNTSIKVLLAALLILSCQTVWATQLIFDSFTGSDSDTCISDGSPSGHQADVGGFWSVVTNSKAPVYGIKGNRAWESTYGGSYDACIIDAATNNGIYYATVTSTGTTYGNTMRLWMRTADSTHSIIVVNNGTSWILQFWVPGGPYNMITYAQAGRVGDQVKVTMWDDTYELFVKRCIDADYVSCGTYTRVDHLLSSGTKHGFGLTNLTTDQWDGVIFDNGTPSATATAAGTDTDTATPVPTSTPTVPTSTSTVTGSVTQTDSPTNTPTIPTSTNTETVTGSSTATATYTYTHTYTFTCVASNLILYDSFTAPNGTTICGTVCDTGQTRICQEIYPYTTPGPVYMGVKDNKGMFFSSTNKGAFGALYYETSVYDCFITAEVLDNALTQDTAYILFRYSNEYNFWTLESWEGLGYMTISKFVNGSYTDVADVVLTPFPPGTWSVGLDGPNITAYLNKTPIITVTNSFNQTATKHGFSDSADASSTVGGGGVTWDSFKVELLNNECTKTETYTATGTATPTRTATATATQTWTQANTRTPFGTNTRTQIIISTKTNTATTAQTNTCTVSRTPTITRTQIIITPATYTRTQTAMADASNAYLMISDFNAGNDPINSAGSTSLHPSAGGYISYDHSMANPTLSSGWTVKFNSSCAGNSKVYFVVGCGVNTDWSTYDNVAFWVRGNSGGEKVVIYVLDVYTNMRESIDFFATTSWSQKIIAVPAGLELCCGSYSPYGFWSSMKEVWFEMGGTQTIWIANVSLGRTP